MIVEYKKDIRIEKKNWKKKRKETQKHNFFYGSHFALLSETYDNLMTSLSRLENLSVGETSSVLRICFSF